MKRALLAAALVACTHEPAHVDLPQPLPAAPQPSVSLHPREPLFPEDPSLDAVAVSNPAFRQETWTGATDWQQHCREWGMSPSRKDEVREATNALLAPRGVHFPDKARANHVVVALGEYVTGVVVREPLIKLVVCTEGIAPRDAHDAFTARLLADPNAPHSPEIDALGAPDVAWERFHSTGEIEFGLRYPHVDETAAKAAIARIEADKSGRTKAKMRGQDLWWTGRRK